MSASINIACESLEAYVDGELSAAESAAFDRHLRECTTCQTQVERQLRLRAQLRASLAKPPASEALSRRILSALPQDRTASARQRMPRRQWFAMAAAASVGAILAGSGTLFLMRPDNEQDWQHAILTSHLRATLSGHVIDVASSDRHTVRPWFGGKTKVAPKVRDLAGQGYPLLGGRLDIPQQEALPVLVYKAGSHVISLFVRKADVGAQDGYGNIDGFSILTWSSEGLAYSAVSDADRAELQGFQRAFTTAQ